MSVTGVSRVWGIVVVGSVRNERKRIPRDGEGGKGAGVGVKWNERKLSMSEDMKHIRVER